MKKLVFVLVLAMVSAVLFAQNNTGNDFGIGSGRALNITPGTVHNAMLQSETSYWYRFVMPVPGGVFTAYTDSNIDTVMWLYNAAGEQLEYDDDGGVSLNARISRFCTPGTYFIRVGGYGSTSGYFSLHVNVPPITNITPGTVRNATLQGDAEHIYQVTVSAGTLIAWTDSNIDTIMTFCNSAGDELDYDDDGGAGLNARISRFVLPGTYFIIVDGYDNATGHYSLHVSLNAAQITDVRPGSVHNATLQANANHLYRVTLPQGRITIWTDSNIDTRMWLYDSVGNELVDDDDSGTGNNALISHYCTPGTYYIKVSGYSEFSTGPYSLHIQNR